MCSCYFFWWIKLNHVFILLYHCLLIFETGFLHFRKSKIYFVRPINGQT